MPEIGAGSPRLEVATGAERARGNLGRCSTGGVPAAEALEDSMWQG